MPSSSLGDKIARNPLQFGMIAGFIGIPVLWMAGDSLVRVLLGQGVFPVEAFWRYEASGALVGALLGGQGVRIWALWRVGQIGEARRLALSTGAVGVAFYVGRAALFAGTSPYFLRSFAAGLVSLVLQHHLPFLICLLLLIGGWFAPRK